MTLDMYQASVATFRPALASLAKILDKAEAYAQARKIDPAALTTARLFPDMFALARQVQLTTDFAKGAGARLAGIDVPRFEDTETTFPELRARIAKTADFLSTLTPAQFDGSDTRQITLTVGGQPRTYGGADYLLRFALPNFYFHMTTAYNILRHNGLDIGKRDFLGEA